MALRRVVPHTGQGPADLADGLVVEVAAAAALQQAAGLAEPGRRLVEVGPAALAVIVGEAALEVLDAAFESVERVTGQGVRTGSGDSAEGSGGHADAEAAGGEALGQPCARPEPLQRGRPMGTTGPALLGHRRVRRLASGAALLQHGLERGHELGPLDDLDLGIQLRAGQRRETVGEGQQAPLLRLFRCVVGRCGSLGLLGRRAPIGLLLQSLGEGVRPPVRRYVRDHWRHLLSS